MQPTNSEQPPVLSHRRGFQHCPGSKEPDKGRRRGHRLGTTAFPSPGGYGLYYCLSAPVQSGHHRQNCGAGDVDLDVPADEPAAGRQGGCSPGVAVDFGRIGPGQSSKRHAYSAQDAATPGEGSIGESGAGGLPRERLSNTRPAPPARLMVPEYPFVSLDETVAEALANLRDMGSLRYEFSRVYVVDGNGGLAGQISVVDLALSLEQARIRDILGPVTATVTPDTPAAECARLLRHYNIMQLPVVSEGTLIGVIPSEFLLSAVVEEDTRQMLNVGAVSGDSGETSMASAIRTRLPWLTVNLGTTFLAAATISLFESTLAQVVILAAFLPVVAGQGGIGGTQTLTMIVRSIALGEFVGVSAWRLLTREALLGALHGVWLGVLVGVIALLWTRNPALGMVLGLAMVGNMVIAGVAGAGVPPVPAPDRN